MMTSFLSGISFLWALLAVFIFACIWGFRAWNGYRNLETDARQDWQYRVSNNMQDLRLTEQAYVRAYKKANAPRAQLYLAAGGLSIVILTPIVLALGNLGLYLGYLASGKNRVYEPGYLVWMFFLFFAVIILWVTIGAVISRRYHKKSPGPMRDIIMEEHLNFVPDSGLIVGSNPVHIDGSGNEDQLHTIFASILGLTKTSDENWQNSGHACVQYSDGSNMKICVHSPNKNGGFTRGTHPFFFARKHAREDDKQIEYTLIFKLKNTYKAFKKIEKTNFMHSSSNKNEMADMHDFKHKNLNFYLYEDRS